MRGPGLFVFLVFVRELELIETSGLSSNKLQDILDGETIICGPDRVSGKK